MTVTITSNHSKDETVEEVSLLDLLLLTVPHQHHPDIIKAVNENGVVASISHIVTNYWDHHQKEQAVGEVSQWLKLDQEARDTTKSIYVKILVDAFGVDKHLNQVLKHKKFINKTFTRFGKIFPNVSEKQILEHDSSKYSFIEMIGYTDRWVWSLSSPAWHTALQHHYQHNPHHPQHTNTINISQISQEEGGQNPHHPMSTQEDNDHHPQHTNTINMSQSSQEEGGQNPHHPISTQEENDPHPQHTNTNNTINKMSQCPQNNQCCSNQMCQSHLEESVVDMLACEWEKRQGGREGATAREIAGFGGVFLERYTKQDRTLVEVLLESVRHSNL